MIRVLAAAGVGVSAVTIASSAAAELRPPYLTQAKPLYGDVAIAQREGKVWTYRGDWILAVFDYDTVNGDPSLKRLPYTVCRVAASRQCVRRVWLGRPDVWMVRVLDWIGTRPYAEFTWTVSGKLRRTARVWIHE